MTTRPSVLIPIAPGTNRNEELAVAFEAAGAATAQVPLQALRDGETKLVDHQLLAVPGGFSYGDALGAGRLLGLDLTRWFADQLHEARDRQMPIIGICNGFQALVSAGLLPGDDAPPATLAANDNGRFECRWVTLVPERSAGAVTSVWTAELSGPIRCPVAHCEGRFTTTDPDRVSAAGLVALRYGTADGTPAGGRYPDNPNGSVDDIAGVVDSTGLVLGMMPHPEDHVFQRQDPLRGRVVGGLCLPLFRAGVSAVVG